MSNDTAECGCEGHVENFSECKYPALLERVRRLEEALREVHTTPREAMSLDQLMDLDRRVQRLLGLGGA